MGSGQMTALRDAFERLTDVDTAAEALSETQTYRTKFGSFASPLARKMACDGKTSPGMFMPTRLSDMSCLTPLNILNDDVFH